MRGAGETHLEQSDSSGRGETLLRARSRKGGTLEQPGGHHQVGQPATCEPRRRTGEEQTKQSPRTRGSGERSEGFSQSTGLQCFPHLFCRETQTKPPRGGSSDRMGSGVLHALLPGLLLLLCRFQFLFSVLFFSFWKRQGLAERPAPRVVLRLALNSRFSRVSLPSPRDNRRVPRTQLRFVDGHKAFTGWIRM